MKINGVELHIGPGANLSGADLTRANLTGANLTGADLTEANLTRAGLSGATLTGATLIGANLIGADLIEADLTWADLTWANLTEADLIEANLSGAYYNPVILLSQVNWVNVSDNLCKILMAYDAQNHPNPSAFNEWKKTLNCPYDGMNIFRAVNFHQDVELWDKRLITKKIPSALGILKMLFKEKGIKSELLK